MQPPKPTIEAGEAGGAAVVREQGYVEARGAGGVPGRAGRRRRASATVAYMPATGPASSPYGASAAATRGARAAYTRRAERTTLST